MKKQLILVALLSTALLGSGSVWAVTADDVDCNGCIRGNEIARQTITQKNIAKNSIGENKIKSEAVSTGKIKDRAITADKLSDEVYDAIGEASYSTNTACAPGYAVVGKDSEGNFNCELMGVYAEYVSATGSAIAEASCPVDTFPVSAGCVCSSDNGSSNYGVLFICTTNVVGAIAACFNEPVTFNPNLNDPIATINVLCATQSAAATQSVGMLSSEDYSVQSDEAGNLDAETAAQLELVREQVNLHTSKLRNR